MSATLLGIGQDRWEIATIFYVLIFGLIIGAIGITRNKKKITINESFEVNDTYKVISRFLWGISFAATVLTLISNGFNLNAMREITGFDLKTASRSYTEASSSIIGWLVHYLPFTAVNSIFELVYSGKRKNWIYNLFVIISSLLFTWRVLYSRGTLIIIILGALFIINSKEKIKFRKIAIIGLLFIVLLYYLMSIRLDMSSYVFQGNFNNALLNSTYNYSAFCFQRFNSVVKDGSSYAIGANTWFSLYKMFGINTLTGLSKFTNISAAICCAAWYYDDLGFIGIVIYATLTGYIYSSLYNRIGKKPYSVLMLAALQKPVFTMFFGNYLFPIFTVTISYLLTALLIVLAEKNSLHIRIKKSKHPSWKLKTKRYIKPS